MPRWTVLLHYLSWCTFCDNANTGIVLVGWLVGCVISFVWNEFLWRFKVEDDTKDFSHASQV